MDMWDAKRQKQSDDRRHALFSVKATEEALRRGSIVQVIRTARVLRNMTNFLTESPKSWKGCISLVYFI